MQESNDNNSGVTPYRAAGNLNVSIGIPSIDVNDPMNINIQSANTNPSLNNNAVNNVNSVPTNTQNNVENNVQNSGQNNTLNNVQSSVDSASNTSNVNNMQNIDQNNNNLNNNKEVSDNPSVKRNFVSNEDRNKKKKVSFNLGPELKIALLIGVVLLAFVLLLPLIT